MFYNFFRSIKKTNGWRIGANGKHIRTYDKPCTPFQRVIDSNILTTNEKQKLIRKREELNPCELSRKIVSLQNMLLANARRKPESDGKYNALVEDLIQYGMKEVA